MKKRSGLKKGMLACVALAACLLLPTMTLRAEAPKQYTVTFRPGNVGHFAFSADAAGSKQEQAQAVADQVYTSLGYAATATQNGAIKVTVDAGETIPQAPGYIVSDEGYFVKDASLWGPAGESAEKNVDYVVDYGKLINGVEYTVEYVDSQSGDSIAPIYIAQANIGESRSVTAPSRIVISGGTVYNLTSSATVQKTLSENPDENLFTFSYKMAPSGEEVIEITEYVDGGTVTTTETYTTYIDNGQRTTGAAVLPQAQGGAGNADANAAGNENDGEDIVDIQDEETPLEDQAGTEDGTDNSGNTDVVQIQDDIVPLASSSASEQAVKILAGVFAGAAVILVATWFLTRRKKKNEQHDA